MIIGMCDGVFDLMHVGHIRLLAACKQQCDILVVAVADDAFARHKGKDRPFIPEVERLFSIKSLRFVDHAFLCDGSVSVVNRQKPNLYFKKWDYVIDPGLDKKIKLVRMQGYESTTELVRVIRKRTR